MNGFTTIRGSASGTALSRVTLGSEKHAAESIGAEKMATHTLHKTLDVGQVASAEPLVAEQDRSFESVGEYEAASPEVARDRERRRFLAEWREGDESAKQKLIESLTELVQRVATQKSRRYRRDSGEFTSIAWETMVEALDSLYRCGHDNVGGYITVALRHAIDRHVHDESKRNEISLEAAIVEGQEPSVSFDDVSEVWEELSACCETEDDRFILALRADGDTFEQIAETLSKPRSTVYSRLRTVERRYWERNG